MGLCDRYEGRVHTEEGEGVPIIKGRERGSQRNCKGAVEEGLYLTIKVSTNGTSIFVGKKDGKKWMVQDYRYLNEWTVKNNYPLPLISDVLENIGTKESVHEDGLEVGI